MTKELSISQAAEQTGVGREALRYYESQGLIHAARTEGGFRSYSHAVVDRIRFIKRARELDFTLQEIGELLALEGHPDQDERSSTCEEIRELAVKKLNEIELKLLDLARMKAVLSDLTSRCTGGGTLSECPIIKTFLNGG